MISIDASVFLGMHCEEQGTSINCRSIIIQNLNKGILISYEEIGRIDGFIWGYPLEKQMVYFEFMDLLMSKGRFVWKPYNLDLFNTKKPLPLVLAEKNKLQLYSLNEVILSFENTRLPVNLLSHLSFENFDSTVEEAYVRSKKVLAFSKSKISQIIYE